MCGPQDQPVLWPHSNTTPALVCINAAVKGEVGGASAIDSLLIPYFDLTPQLQTA